MPWHYKKIILRVWAIESKVACYDFVLVSWILSRMASKAVEKFVPF